MRRWDTPWNRLRRPDRRSRALACAGVALLLLVGIGSGCVSRNAYREVVAERDRLFAAERKLAARVRQLEASTESLDAERVRLIDEMEDLRQQRGRLERDLKSLRRKERELRESLQEHQSKLEKVSELQGTYQNLIDDLEAEVASGQIQIQQLREGLLVNVSDEILFPSGSSQLNQEGREVLVKVAARLASLPHGIEVQGHTDNVPIRGSLTKRYATNWELAAARATRVVRLFAEKGVDPNRLQAVSFGEHRPIAPNDTPENRTLNRRIEIRLLPYRKADTQVDTEELVAPPDDRASPGPTPAS